MNRLLISVLLALIVSITTVAPAFAKDGDQVRFGRDIEVPPEQTVNGDLVTMGGSITVAGRVIGDAVAIGGNVDVSGEVVGQVVSVGGRVHLASTARVQRGVVVVGGSLEREEGAQVRGETVETGPGGLALPRFGPWSLLWRAQHGPTDGLGLAFAVFSSLMMAIALIAIAVLAAAVFPTRLNVVRSTAEAVPLQALGVGVLSAIVAVALTVPLILTCIGLPIFWLAVVVATLFGVVGLALAIGERILVAFNARGFTPVVAAGVGVLVLWLVSLLPILGGILMLFTMFFGLGTVVLSRFGTISPPFSWQAKGPPTGG